jgi:F-type H+-transporting ATPase subunit epsilon
VAKTFRLQIVTPEKLEFDEDVEIVVAPGIEGELGIMADHLPLITRLKIGVLKILTESEEITMAVSEGYLEVTRERVLILAEAAELPEEINVQRALEAKRRAEERLASAEKQDFARAQAALERAMTRLKVAGRQ